MEPPGGTVIVVRDAADVLFVGVFLPLRRSIIASFLGCALSSHYLQTPAICRLRPRSDLRLAPLTPLTPPPRPGS